MKYTYKRTWQSEAAHAAAVLLFVYPFAFVLIHLFSYQMLPVIFIVVILGGITLIGGAHIYSAAKLRQDFVCSISHGQLQCFCPDPQFGESFEIAIAELSEIEVVDGCVTLRMLDSSEHWFTSNYGNPNGYFINLLLEANPKSKLVHV